MYVIARPHQAREHFESMRIADAKASSDAS